MRFKIGDLVKIKGMVEYRSDVSPLYQFLKGHVGCVIKSYTHDSIHWYYDVQYDIKGQLTGVIPDIHEQLLENA